MALRRLARRVLYGAPAPPPRPLASLSSDSRACLIHLRFCVTSSSTPPHFIVDYLVSTCGLPPDKAAKAAPRFAHLRSTDKPDAARAFLRSKGLSRAQVRAVVSCCPTLLLSDVDATIAPKFEAVRSVGLTRAEAAKLFALYPPALNWGVRTNLLPRLLFWLDVLGSTRLLMKWLNKEWLLKFSADLLLRNLSTLRGLGIPEARLFGVVRLKPSLIIHTSDKPRALIDRVDACGVPRGSGMYVWALFALHGVSRAAFQAKKDAVMGTIGCTEQEFLAMFRRAPCFLFMSADLLLRKVEFLKDTLGCDADYIVMNPVLLTLSLSKRMVPRCRVIEALRSKGADIGKERLRNVVRLSEAKFMERYILRYSKEAPELHELYPPEPPHPTTHTISSSLGE
jgi:mTERF domain-containing protein, mitochondrial